MRSFTPRNTKRSGFLGELRPTPLADFVLLPGWRSQEPDQEPLLPTVMPRRAADPNAFVPEYFDILGCDDEDGA